MEVCSWNEPQLTKHRCKRIHIWPEVEKHLSLCRGTRFPISIDKANPAFAKTQTLRMSLGMMKPSSIRVVMRQKNGGSDMASDVFRHKPLDELNNQRLGIRWIEP